MPLPLCFDEESSLDELDDEFELLRLLSFTPFPPPVFSSGAFSFPILLDAFIVLRPTLIWHLHARRSHAAENAAACTPLARFRSFVAYRFSRRQKVHCLGWLVDCIFASNFY